MNLRNFWIIFVFCSLAHVATFTVRAADEGETVELETDNPEGKAVEVKEAKENLASSTEESAEAVASPAVEEDKKDEGKAEEPEQQPVAGQPEQEKPAEQAVETSISDEMQEPKEEEQKPQAMEAPKAPSERKPEAISKKQAEEELPGIDTLGLEEPGGNWLFKRIWWEKAETRFEKIRSMVEQLFEERMVFLKQRSELDHNLFDPFYREVGLERGELREIVLYLIERIEKMRQSQGSLDEEERDFLNTLIKEQKTLEQLQTDIDGIDKLDKAIDESIMLLADQINRARNYENSAWQEFKAIGKELNDKRARERYYSMDAIMKSIQDIDAYIKGAFSQHFQALSNSAKEHVERVKTAVKTLQERRIDLKIEAEKLENADKQVSVEETEEVQPGFFASIFHAIGKFFSSLWGFLFGWIGSSKA